MKTLKIRLAAAVAIVLGLVFSASNARAVTIDTASLPNGTEMVAYDTTLSASGGTSPYTWDVVAQTMERAPNSWSTVSAAATEPLDLHEDDNVRGPFALPFAFPFYGKTYTQVWINPNGGLFFGENCGSYYSNVFSSAPGVLFVGGKDNGTRWTGDDIFVCTNASEAVFRYAGHGYNERADEPSTINAAVVLKPDGELRIVYGTVARTGDPSYTVGIGCSNVQRWCQDFPQSELSESSDFVFKTGVVEVPGLALTSGGVLSGKPEVAGTYPLFVQVSDSSSATAVKSLLLTIEENPNHKPVIESQTPAAEEATVAHGEAIDFAVTVSDSDTLSYSWKVNGVEKSTAGSAWTWTTDLYDGGERTVTCDIFDGVWTVTATWKVYITRGFSWYVNGATGADENTGYDADHPFKTIAKALSMAIDGETILVAEGTYVEGSDEINNYKYPKIRVTDGRHLTIRATGARAATIIDGGSETSCLWLNDKQTINTNVVVEGFTIQNGQASWLTGVGAIGGGAFGGLLRNCTIQNCTAGSGNSGYGGGAAHARLENCTVTGCKAHSEGGALKGCDAEGCDIRWNSMGGNSSYARGCATVYGTLVNCLIADNEFESTVVGGSGAVYQSELYGCTVAGNRNNASSNRNGAGVYGESYYTKLFNTIVYGNLSDGQPDELQNVDGADLATCCTNDPSFVDAAAGDYRLKPTSVCHNAGKNSYVTGASDLAGKARIQEWTVDLGAYEYCPVMTITAAPTQATVGTAYSYTLTQTGGADPVVWEIDDASETKNTAAEVTESSTYAVLGEKLFDGSGSTCEAIDLPFAFPYGGTNYTRAGICDYGSVTLGNGTSFSTYSGYNKEITDADILSRPMILPYLACNWGTYYDDGCGVFVDQSIPQQVTIRWVAYYRSEHYRANFSMTLYANGEIRFAYGEIEKGYNGPNVIGLSFGDGEHHVDALNIFSGSNANDILFRPVAIPEGISLSDNQLVGTPTTGGTYSFRVTATEDDGETQSKIVTMNVLSGSSSGGFAAWAEEKGLTGADAAWDAKPAKWGGKWENAFIYTYGEGLADGSLDIMNISFNALGKPVITTTPVVEGHTDFTPAVIGVPTLDDWTSPVILNRSGDDWTLPTGAAANFFRVRLTE